MTTPIKCLSVCSPREIHELSVSALAKSIDIGNQRVHVDPDCIDLLGIEMERRSSPGAFVKNVLFVSNMTALFPLFVSSLKGKQANIEDRLVSHEMFERNLFNLMMFCEDQTLIVAMRKTLKESKFQEVFQALSDYIPRGESYQAQELAMDILIRVSMYLQKQENIKDKELCSNLLKNLPALVSAIKQRGYGNVFANMRPVVHFINHDNKANVFSVQIQSIAPASFVGKEAKPYPAVCGYLDLNKEKGSFTLKMADSGEELKPVRFEYDSIVNFNFLWTKGDSAADKLCQIEFESVPEHWPQVLNDSQMQQAATHVYNILCGADTNMAALEQAVKRRLHATEEQEERKMTAVVSDKKKRSRTPTTSLTRSADRGTVVAGDKEDKEESGTVSRDSSRHRISPGKSPSVSLESPTRRSSRISTLEQKKYTEPSSQTNEEKETGEEEEEAVVEIDEVTEKKTSRSRSRSRTSSATKAKSRSKRSTSPTISPLNEEQLAEQREKASKHFLAATAQQKRDEEQRREQKKRVLHRREKEKEQQMDLEDSTVMLGQPEDSEQYDAPNHSDAHYHQLENVDPQPRRKGKGRDSSRHSSHSRGASSEHLFMLGKVGKASRTVRGGTPGTSPSPEDVRMDSSGLDFNQERSFLDQPYDAHAVGAGASTRAGAGASTRAGAGAGEDEGITISASRASNKKKKTSPQPKRGKKRDVAAMTAEESDDVDIEDSMTGIVTELVRVQRRRMHERQTNQLRAAADTASDQISEFLSQWHSIEEEKAQGVEQSVQTKFQRVRDLQLSLEAEVGTDLEMFNTRAKQLEEEGKSLVTKQKGLTNEVKTFFSAREADILRFKNDVRDRCQDSAKSVQKLRAKNKKDKDRKSARQLQERYQQEMMDEEEG